MLNAAWVVCFQYELFIATVPLIVGLLVTLIRISAITFADRGRLVSAARWTVRLPFSVYLGWVTVATIANIAQTLQALGVTVPPDLAPVLASAVLLVGLAIAVTFVWRFADAAYGAVIVWAYVGIAVEEFRDAGRRSDGGGRRCRRADPGRDDPPRPPWSVAASDAERRSVTRVMRAA